MEDGEHRAQCPVTKELIGLRAAINELEADYAAGDTTALLDALGRITFRGPFLEDVFPRWFIVALTDAVLAKIRSEPGGKTTNQLNVLEAAATDFRRCQLVQRMRAQGHSIASAYRAASAELARTGETVSPVAIRKSCERVEARGPAAINERTAAVLLSQIIRRGSGNDSPE